MVQSVYTTTTESDSNGGGAMDKPNSTTELPRTKTPPFVYVLTILSAIGGFLFGYDTGVVSGAMLLIRPQFQLNAIWQELIVSATIGAAFIFSLVGGFLTEILGRKPVIIIASFVFTVGAVLMGFSPTKEALLVGRIIVGIGIGLMSCSVPVYIAETSPSNLRGKLVSFYVVMIGGGQFTGAFVAAVSSTADSSHGWRFMLGLAAIPGLIQFIGFLGMPESPRWLIKKGQYERAVTILRTIRGVGADIDSEFETIKQSCEDSAEDLEHGSSVLVEIFKTPTVRRALIVGSALQMFQQLCGINTVMYYSATIIEMSGIRDTTLAIWLSAVTASVNFVFTFLGLYLVEKVGRRPLTLGSLGGVILSLIVLAVGFQLAAVTSPAITYSEASPFARNDSCSYYKSCSSCVSDDSCGFCFDSLESGFHNGSCIAVASVHNVDVSHYGRCSNFSYSSPSANNSNNLSWDYGYCPASYEWLPILGLCLYLFCFAPGLGPMPWTINSEIYPLWARSTCYAIATSFNWIFNLAVSMTFLTLTDVLTKYGAFYLYAGISLVGLIFFFFTVPETRGKSLEEVEGLFAQPFCCGRNEGLTPPIATNGRTIQKMGGNLTA